MPLTTETLLAYSMGIIGTLLVLLISLVVYVFLTLREEVRGVSSDLSELNKHRVKLVHIDDCRLTVARVHERLDDYEDAMQGLSERMARTRGAVAGAGRAFMNQSFFKEILEQEIHSVFLNPAEFGESVTLEGRTLDAVVDRPEMAWPEADDRPGVSHRLVVLSVALSDFPDELYPGTSVTFNGERWFVATADREALRTIRLYREAA